MIYEWLCVEVLTKEEAESSELVLVVYRGINKVGGGDK